MNAIYILTGLGIFSLLAEVFNGRRFVFPVVLFGLIASALFLVFDWDHDAQVYSKMLTFDNYAVAFSIVLSLTTAVWFLMSRRFFENHENVADHFALILFALVGAVFMVSYSNL